VLPQDLSAAGRPLRASDWPTIARRLAVVVGIDPTALASVCVRDRGSASLRACLHAAQESQRRAGAPFLVSIEELVRRMRRSAAMTEESNDRPPGIDPDHPQRLLVLAYTRLFLLPERPNARRSTTIASYGAFDVRLVEPSSDGTDGALLVELYDSKNRRVIDAVGCRDLQEAGAATEKLISEAARRSAQ
jgi:hypothetical protein